jgi:hypothetical protein
LRQRYEAANLPNATIPTNIEVKDAIKGRFPEFYAALFDKTVEATLQQQRRARLGDEHYFDHPHIGIIAVINRYQPDGNQSAP